MTCSSSLTGHTADDIGDDTAHGTADEQGEAVP